eukprot:6959830-Pyramimonas_sp.AAC.1
MATGRQAADAGAPSSGGHAADRESSSGGFGLSDVQEMMRRRLITAATSEATMESSLVDGFLKQLL